MKKIWRGEIYYADLSHTVGSEQEGIRPVLIIQNDIGNRYSPTTIVAAISASTARRKFPTHVPITTNKLKKGSKVLLEQIRTIDKRRLVERVGKIDATTIQEVDKAIEISLGIFPQKTIT